MKLPKNCKPGNITMNSLWILPFFLTLGSAIPQLTSDRISCHNGTASIQLWRTENSTKINNIFSNDREHNCSLSNNDFTGNGTKASPYAIFVDIDPSRKTYNPCGGKVYNGSRWSVEFVIKSFEDFFGKDDEVLKLDCPIDDEKDNHIRIISTHIPNYRGKLNIGPMMMSLVSANSTKITDAELVLGQKVKLRIEIPENSEAQRGRVTLCYVQDTLYSNSKQKFHSTKCSFSGFQIPVNFTTDEKNPKLIESTEFDAFRLNVSGKVQFICYVEACAKETDRYCLDTDCVKFGTFLHPYIEVKSLSYSVVEEKPGTSGASKMMSFTLMPVAAVLIIFTKINWF